MTLLATSCVLLSLGLAASAENVTELCPGINHLLRVPSSAEGTWWVVGATPVSSGQCGLNNNQPPCKCIGMTFTSDLDPPYIPQYNVSVSGFDLKSLKYDRQHVLLSLVDKSQPWAIFNIIDKTTGSKSIVAGLDTDDHESFMVLYMCDVETGEGEPIIIVVSKIKEGLPASSQNRIDSVLKRNNFSKDLLEAFDTSCCPSIQ